MDIKRETKILFFVFIIHRDSLNNNRNNKFYDYQTIFRSLDINWWVKPNTAHHRGLAYQSILNTDDMNEAYKICEDIQKQFDEPLLFCLKKDIVSNREPVGESTDRAWWEIGRFFDRKVKELYTKESGFINDSIKIFNLK